MASIHFNTSSRTDQSSRKYPEDHTNNNRRNSVYHCQGLVLDSKSAEHLEEEECKLPDEEDAHLSEEERPSFALPTDNDDDDDERPSLALPNDNGSYDDDDDDEDVLGSPIGLRPVPCPAVCVHDKSLEEEEQQQSTLSNERNDPEERPFSV